MASVVCSTCGRQFDTQQSTALPFCSERCRMVDLHRWLAENYGLPEDPEAEDEL
jgi:uncharacterized protein